MSAPITNGDRAVIAGIISSCESPDTDPDIIEACGHLVLFAGLGADMQADEERAQAYLAAGRMIVQAIKERRR